MRPKDNLREIQRLLWGKEGLVASYEKFAEFLDVPIMYFDMIEQENPSRELILWLDRIRIVLEEIDRFTKDKSPVPITPTWKINFLKDPNKNFGGERPIEMLKTKEGFEKVVRLFRGGPSSNEVSGEYHA